MFTSFFGTCALSPAPDADDDKPAAIYKVAFVLKRAHVAQGREQNGSFCFRTGYVDEGSLFFSLQMLLTTRTSS